MQNEHIHDIPTAEEARELMHRLGITPAHEHSHDHHHDHAHEYGPHGHTHSHEHTKAVLNRLSRAIGHL